MAEEKYTVSGSELVEKIKQLVHEGNIRRIRIVHKGQNILEIPLTIGASATVVTMLAAPVLVAVGALAVLITDCTIIVEKIEEKPKN